MVGTVTKKENLRVKVYSMGRIDVTVITDSYRGTFGLDLEPGKEKFISCKKSGITVSIKEKTEDWGKAQLSGVEKTIEVEENIKMPYGKLPNDFAGNRPKSGSGFLINKSGSILTNFHVVEGAKSVSVKGIKGDFKTSLDASIVSIDRQNDLAVLKIESSLISFDEPPYSIRSSKTVQSGEEVFALGYPIKDIMGQEIKVTTGVINALTGLQGSVSEFQFSATVQPGNSGGPLFDKDGQLIGIVTSKLKREIGEGVGYAIKSDYLAFFLDQVDEPVPNQEENSLTGKELPDLVKEISDFVLLIEAK